LIECPCGTAIESSSKYVLLFLKKELFEIDILCPNEMCYLRELGYVRFSRSGHEVMFKEASFYPPFVTWNMTQLGKDCAQQTLKQHLKEIVTKHIKWDEIAEVTRRILDVEKGTSVSGSPCSTGLGRPSWLYLG
jgi:hypothetical protein